jgi:hypothetical protein
VPSRTITVQQFRQRGQESRSIDTASIQTAFSILELPFQISYLIFNSLRLRRVDFIVHRGSISYVAHECYTGRWRSVWIQFPSSVARQTPSFRTRARASPAIVGTNLSYSSTCTHSRAISSLFLSFEDRNPGIDEWLCVIRIF